MPTPIAVKGTEKLSSRGRGKDSTIAETRATAIDAAYVLGVAGK